MLPVFEAPSRISRSAARCFTSCAKACEDLKIEKLDLYAGTRHTSITDIAQRYGEQSAIKTSGHNTNKALERYCRVQDCTALEMAKARAESVKGGGSVIAFEKVKVRK